MRPAMVLCALCLAVAYGCAGLNPRATPADSFRNDGRVISADEIAASDARTAWDVVERTGLFRMLSEPGAGRAAIRSKRGRGSILLQYVDVPRLIVDGARVSDPRYLRDIPAVSVAYIRIVGGITGGANEGMNSGGGVIYVVSKAGL